MKAILLLAAFPTAALAVCTPQSNGTVICSDPPEIFCQSPNAWDPIGRACRPPMPTQALTPLISGACAINISYTDADPSQAVLTVTPGCSDKGIDYALSSLLARLRWSR